MALSDSRDPDEATAVSVLMRSLSDMVWLKNPQGVFLACSPAFAAGLDLSEEAILGKADSELTFPEAIPFYGRAERNAREQRSPATFEESTQRADDSKVRLEVTV